MKTKIRFYNARILDIKTGDVKRGSLETENGKITKVSYNAKNDSEKIGDSSHEREIDANGNLLIPSFKNAHSHSPMTILRAMAENVALNDWLFNIIFPLEAKLTEDDVYWGTKLAILEMLRSGITATFDMYFFTASAAKAFKEAGFKASFCSAISGDDVKTAIKRLETEYDTLNSYSPLIKYYAGCHAEYTASEDLLKGISKFVNERKVPFYTHMSEAVGETEGCIERRGCSPASLFDRLGLWNYGGGVYHAVHVSDEDIALMKKHNIYVTTNPCCNAKIASGVAPILKYLDNGITVGVGTDGPASNNSLSMFKEMYMLVCTERLATMKPDVMSAFKALQMATMNSATIMGWNNALSLDEGQDADLVMIDMHSPNMQPESDIANNLVYAGGNELVLLTMVNGKILYENGKFNIDVDPKDVYKKVNSIKERIKG